MEQLSDVREIIWNIRSAFYYMGDGVWKCYFCGKSKKPMSGRQRNEHKCKLVHKYQCDMDYARKMREEFKENNKDFEYWLSKQLANLEEKGEEQC